MTLRPDQLHRASGVLLAQAAGDALGAGYETGPVMPAEAPLLMRTGYHGFEPGEWTDDTDMAIVVARALVDHGPVPTAAAYDAMVQGWCGWVLTARDVGIHTRMVLRDVRSVSRDAGRAPAESDAVQASQALHERSGRPGGNGSLMRTSPLALAYLQDDPGQLFQAAADVSRLTHWEEDARDACGLWSVAIRHAVLTGDLDVRSDLAFVHPSRRAVWEQRIAAAEQSVPGDFTNNPWVVEAFQGAGSAIASTSSGAADPTAHVTTALKAAVRGGNDTDTVAAIAGGLLGATYGPAAVKPEWERMLHGWPGIRGGDLVDLALQVAAPRSRKQLIQPVLANQWQRIFGPGTVRQRG
jgi:ADP-ribosyl-[dinitrogen reductase] hydrolase